MSDTDTESVNVGRKVTRHVQLFGPDGFITLAPGDEVPEGYSVSNPKAFEGGDDPEPEPENPSNADVGSGPIEGRTKSQLVALGAQFGVVLDENDKKDDLIDALAAEGIDADSTPIEP